MLRWVAFPLVAAVAGCAPASIKPPSIDCALAVVITRGASGCGSVPRASSERDDDGKRFVVPPGRANVYVVRPSIVGGRFPWQIQVDGRPVGRVAAHTYLLVETEPGPHLVTAITAENEHSIKVEARPGESSFVEAVSRMGMTEARAALRAMSPEQGRTAVADAKRVESLQDPLRGGGAAASLQYVNPIYRWSVKYPGTWNLDDAQPRSVKFSKGQAVLGIHTGNVAEGLSLTEVADDSLKAWQSRIGTAFTQISRREVALASGIRAIEIVHHLGTGVVGKSRKIVAASHDLGFWIDAETFLDDWPRFEGDFDAIIQSFSIPPSAAPMPAVDR